MNSEKREKRQIKGAITEIIMRTNFYESEIKGLNKLRIKSSNLKVRNSRPLICGVRLGKISGLKL